MCNGYLKVNFGELREAHFIIFRANRSDANGQTRMDEIDRHFIQALRLTRIVHSEKLAFKYLNVGEKFAINDETPELRLLISPDDSYMKHF